MLFGIEEKFLLKNMTQRESKNIYLVSGETKLHSSIPLNWFKGIITTKSTCFGDKPYK